ncbi:mannosyltransferase, partial [Pseudomonas sp. SIMBA_064]
PDGLEFSGLRTALAGLGLYPKAHRLSHDHPGFATSGFWDPQYIIDFRPDKYDSTLEGDLFTHLTLLQKRRAYADADSQITSNHAVNKAKWANYLSLATN